MLVRGEFSDWVFLTGGLIENGQGNKSSKRGKGNFRRGGGGGAAVRREGGWPTGEKTPKNSNWGGAEYGKNLGGTGVQIGGKKKNKRHNSRVVHPGARLFGEETRKLWRKRS